MEIRTEDGVTQVQEVGGGYGHYGAQNDLTLHFGLGFVTRGNGSLADESNTEDTYSLVGGERYLLTGSIGGERSGVRLASGA